MIDYLGHDVYCIIEEKLPNDSIGIRNSAKVIRKKIETISKYHGHKGTRNNFQIFRKKILLCRSEMGEIYR